MSEVKLPLFPLHTVLFPDGPLPLRVFEPRYLDMISDCLRKGGDFGISLIREGSEIGKAASTHEIGTIAHIHDWHMRHDGLLGVTVRGGERFRIVREHVQTNQLVVADVELFAPETVMDVPQEYLALGDLTRRLISQISFRYMDFPKRFGDASWLGFRLAELLPIKLSQKQYFLQLTDPVLRLERLGAVLEQLELQV
ncbi:MAG: LON peptidase substrate-binding domain-containing protein [Pseudomonadota bacterium]